MTFKTRISFLFYLLVGLFCLVVLFVSRQPDIAGLFVIDYVKKYGGLYDLCKVSTFRLPLGSFNIMLKDIPVKSPAPKPHDIGDAKVFFTGDSFLMGDRFNRKFEVFTGAPTYKLASRKLEELMDIKNKRPRYLVYEIVERNLIREVAADLARKKLLAIEADVPEQDDSAYSMPLEYLVTHNPVIYPLLGVRCTLRFYLFGEISEKTPLYSLDPPMLFYLDAVEFNGSNKDDADISAYADYIAGLDRQLQNNYGIKVLYLVVPNKFTVYGYDYEKFNFNYTGLKYDNFIPRLQSELDKRNVAYADIYSEFVMHKDEQLYYPSDAHWNEKGAAIALEKLIKLYKREEQKRAGRARLARR